MIQFANPLGLWLLGLFPVLLLLGLAGRWRRSRRLAKWGGTLMERHTEVPAPEGDLAVSFCLYSAVFLSLVALAQPQWGEVVETLRRVGLNGVIVVDTSRSMLTPDAQPTRMERSRMEIRSLLEKCPGDRFGLVACAGVPVTLSPLTEDSGAVSMLLDIADADLIPALGTDLGKALIQASTLLSKGADRDAVVFLFSDGEDQGGTALQAARALQRSNIRVFCVGVGTKAGGPVPGPDGQPMRDPDTGKPAESRLEEGTLKEIASITDGRYWSLQGEGSVVQEIQEELNRLKRREYATRSRAARQDHYGIFLAPAAFLLLVSLIIPGRKMKRKA